MPTQYTMGFQVVIVKKKDGILRLCIDYRKLNQVTVKRQIQIKHCLQHERPTISGGVLKEIIDEIYKNNCELISWQLTI